MADNKEDQVPVADAEVDQPPPPPLPQEEKKAEGEEAPPAAVEKEQNKEAVSAPKEKKKSTRPKTPSHPPYFQMIKEALVALDEKSGSSPYAIAKKMEEKHKAVLPANFRKILALQLKNSEAKGKLIKIKASYKLLGETESKKSSSRPRTSLKARAAAVGDHTKKAKKKKPKTKSVNMNPETGRKRGPKKSGGSKKVKQPRSIRSPAARAKRANN
ncbi:Histone H1 [Linum grandiflorum]